MRERMISFLTLLVMCVYGVVSLFLAHFAQSVSWRFMLAFFPLFVILVGVALLRQSGLVMAVVGFILSVVLAIFEFGTSTYVALGAAGVGFLKSFGISISSVATLLMVFLMKESGALATISKVLKRQVEGNETRALYVGVGFGSFLTALGVTAPALFPPLLVAMGFSPASSVAISVLGYDPTTSFSLLSVPVTLPAQVSGSILGTPINPFEFAFKIAIFLPVISTGFAFAILWLVGGRKSMRRGAVPALICGVVLALAILGTTGLDYFTGVEYIPLRVVGIVGGVSAMVALYLYNKFDKRESSARTEKPPDYPSGNEILRSLSPWIILTVLAAIVSIPTIGTWLSNLPGNFEKIIVFANQSVDLDLLSQIYTWIFVAALLSLITLRLTRSQVKSALNTWARRFASPFLAFSLYFCVAFVMAYSAMEVVNGAMVPSAAYSQLNMNFIMGSTLAAAFGVGYVFVAASLGLFGSIAGGSETSSNVLFMKIQKTASDAVGLNDAGFMTVYGSHAVAGGVASAVTPAKINNAVVTIDESHETESLIMRKHLLIVLLLTITTGVMTGVFVHFGI
jgi:lactate permease